MTLKIELYTRKPFDVEAVQVTTENLEEVAKWCGGAIETVDTPAVNKHWVPARYVRVDVTRPLNDRQTKAFPGDWILKSGSTFKVYTPQAFENNFQKSVAPTIIVNNFSASEGSSITPQKVADALSQARNALK